METNVPLNKVKVVYLLILALLPLNTFLWQFNARCYLKTNTSVCINIALLTDSSVFSRSQRVGAALSNMRWKKIANKGKVLTTFLGLVRKPELILPLLTLVLPDPPQNYSLDFTSSECCTQSPTSSHGRACKKQHSCLSSDGVQSSLSHQFSAIHILWLLKKIQTFGSQS